MSGQATLVVGRLRHEFLKFCVVGGVGFLVDAGILQFCLKLHLLSAILARILSFSIAVITTYELNRRLVFRDASERGYIGQFLGYVTVQSGGFAINLLIYVAALTFFPPPYNVPLVALAIASGCALSFNFIAARVLVFR